MPIPQPLKNTLISLVFLLLSTSALSIQAATPSEDKLTHLFAQLKSAPDQESAVVYESEIWKLWFQSGNEKVDTLMQTAVKKRGEYDFNGAIEVLDQVIALEPNYAEAWNLRATVHFHQEKYEKSLEDIAKALELEPRHFGALAGRAIIRLQQLKPVIARRNIEEALKFHPYLKERHYFPDLVN